MWNHFSLALQSTLVTLYSFFVCRKFLPLHSCFKNKFLTGISLMILPVLLLFLPSSLYSYVSLVGICSMLTGCFLFFRGSIREKVDLLLYIYLTAMFIETSFSIVLIILDFLFPQAGFVTASLYSSEHALTFCLYSLYYLIGITVLYRVFLPGFQRYRYSFQNTKILRRLEYVIFVVILSSNIFPLPFLSKKYTGLSVILYLIFSTCVMYYIMKNCRVFSYQEMQLSLMNLKLKQMENEISSYRHYEEKIQIMRKQNHDISNHLLTLSILAEQEKWQEIEDYISDIKTTTLKE